MQRNWQGLDPNALPADLRDLVQGGNAPSGGAAPAMPNLDQLMKGMPGGLPGLGGGLPGLGSNPFKGLPGLGKKK
ncbi:MAG: hypothetical protein U1E15_10035 [Hyphomicrobiales bacterium]